VKRAFYEAVSEDAKRYEALARQAGASDVHELADFFREIRDQNRRRAEKARRLLAQRVAE
jgi:rubrerythrin